MIRVAVPLAIALLAGSVGAAPEEDFPAAETRGWELLEVYEEALSADSTAVATPEEEATAVEAAEIAIVAEELLSEGDFEIAVLLLEEALDLLGIARPD
jgi:hypothetical protein